MILGSFGFELLKDLKVFFNTCPNFGAFQQASTDVPSDQLDRKKLVSEVAGKSEAVQAATQRAKELTEPWHAMAVGRFLSVALLISSYF